jgi:hypothetical protein
MGLIAGSVCGPHFVGIGSLAVAARCSTRLRREAVALNLEAGLALKVTAQRRALEAELSKLGVYQRGKKSSAGRAVAPKYRNPENPSEKWAVAV